MSMQPEAADWFAECRKASTFAVMLKAELRQLQMENERLRAQRDALLAALKEVMQIYKNASVVVGPMIKMNRVADAAIEAVEGEKT